MNASNKKTITIIAVIAFILAIVLIALRVFTLEDTWICEDGTWVKHGQPADPAPTAGCGGSANANANTSATGGGELIDSFSDCLAAGYPVMEAYPRQCAADGETFTEDIGNELEKTDLITIDSPRPNQIITSPLSVTGQARGTWFFEGTFYIQLTDEDGNILASANAAAEGDWMTEEFVPFSAELIFTAPATGSGRLTLNSANPSGDPDNVDSLYLPVSFSAGAETLSISVYFGNSDLNPNDDCSSVFAVARTINRTPAVARAAIEELIKGPRPEELAKNYYTGINSEAALNSISIVDGAALVDFSDELNSSGGGSCMISLIRSQIEKTLTQFPAVSSIKISVNGDEETALQP